MTLKPLERIVPAALALVVASAIASSTMALLSSWRPAFARALLSSWRPAFARAPVGQYETFDATSTFVKDARTRLTWERGFRTGVTRAAADAYCASLTINGGGFRVPTYPELLTLVDESYRVVFDNGGTKRSYIDFDAFGNTTLDYGFWTTTRTPADATKYFTVEFSSGVSTAQQPNVSLAVRCVKL